MEYGPIPHRLALAVRGTRRTRTGLSRAVLYALLIGVSASAALPFVWATSTAFKPEGDVLAYPPEWVPAPPTLENFARVLGRYPFGRWVFNSAVVAGVSTFLVLLVDSLAGFALGQLRFRGRAAIFSVAVAMLFVPIEVTIVPLYFFFARVHLLDTLPALILPTTANVTGIYILTRFLQGIPRDYIEAAVMDGAGFFRIWRSIALPLSKPALAVVAVLTFVGSWNNLLWPVIVVNSDASRTLPVGIAQFFGGQSGVSGSAPQYGPAMAAAMMATVPVLVLFLALQSYFIRGVAASGLKG